MSGRPKFGLKATFRVLEETRNDAAVSILAHGITLPVGDARSMAIKALIARNSMAGWRAIVRNWLHVRPEEFTLFDSHRLSLASVARESLESADRSLQRPSLKIVADLNLTEEFSRLVALATDLQNSLCDEARKAVRDLCERWSERVRNGKDQPSVRGPLIQALYEGIARFEEHHSAEIVDDWLSVVTWDDSSLRVALVEGSKDRQAIILRRMRHSPSEHVLQLLAGAIHRRSIPKEILEVIADRTEHLFLLLLLQKYPESIDEVSRRHFREMPRCRCLYELTPEQERQMTQGQQESLALLRSANEDSSVKVLRNAVELMEKNSANAPKIAAKLLKLAGGMSVIEVAQSCGDQSTPEKREFKHLIGRVLQWQKHSFVPLQKATTEFFYEFKLNRFLTLIAEWSKAQCYGMAWIVKQTEPELNRLLGAELDNPSPRRRSSAIRSLIYFDLCVPFRPVLSLLSKDPREEVRVAAVEALSHDPSLDASQLLMGAALHASAPTNEAAASALEARGLPVPNIEGQPSPTFPQGVSLSTPQATS